MKKLILILAVLAGGAVFGWYARGIKEKANQRTIMHALARIQLEVPSKALVLLDQKKDEELFRFLIESLGQGFTTYGLNEFLSENPKTKQIADDAFAVSDAIYKKKTTEPNQAPQTTIMAVTPAASHPSRQP
jgi:hypothetical protein